MDIAKIIAYCRNQLEFADLQLDQAYFYQSLPLCVIDAVYLIGVHYRSAEATCNVIRPFCSDPVVRSNAFFVANLQNKLKM